MAIKQVISGPAYANHTVVVPQATVSGSFVNVGGKRGLALQAPRVGGDGLYYTTVGTADVIRVDANVTAFADGAPVYVDATNLIFGSVAASCTLIGFAYRAKPSATAGPLFVVLVPGAINA